MANTYTQLYIQIVFAVKYRARLIGFHWRETLEKYITGIVQAKGHKLLRIACMPEHVHIFIGMRPHESLSDLVRDIKRDSTAFINDRGLAGGRFAWQNGFGAFSYSPVHAPNVIRYIMNQEQHHHISTFREEYEKFLREYEVEFQTKYTFEDPVS